MSGQGSSSSEATVRIEVYLDDRPEAVQVLTAPPFRFQLDTEALEEGEHRLRLVRIEASGGRRERVLPFNVQHQPVIEVEGLQPGATVSGSVDVDVVTPAPPAPPPPAPRGPATWLYVLATVIILGGIWVFFMVVPMYSSLVPKPSSGAAAASSGQAAGPPVDQTLLKAGEKLYASDCQACHQPTGQGMPPTFPAMAGNSFLSDASATVKRIYDGAGSMPSHHSYSAKMLAEVATYIRNTWGNSYGGVSVAEAGKAVPQASSGSSSTGSSSTGSSSSASSSATSSSGAASGTSPSSTASTGTPASSGSAGSAAGSSGAASSASSSSTTSAAMEAGKKLYVADCQGCHQPNGAGMPPTFPALAANNYLSNASNVVKRVFEGKGTMPAHPSYTAKQLADVATYVRNAFGNAYGPVSVAEAKQAAPKAAP